MPMHAPQCALSARAALMHMSAGGEPETPFPSRFLNTKANEIGHSVESDMHLPTLPPVTRRTISQLPTPHVAHFFVCSCMRLLRRSHGQRGKQLHSAPATASLLRKTGQHNYFTSSVIGHKAASW